MNILIIYTYPNHQSFNDAILKVVQQNLSKDHNVNTLDLYEEQFDPILRFDDTHKRRDLSTVSIACLQRALPIHTENEDL